MMFHDWLTVTVANLLLMWQYHTILSFAITHKGNKQQKHQLLIITGYCESKETAARAAINRTGRKRFFFNVKFFSAQSSLYTAIQELAVAC